MAETRARVLSPNRGQMEFRASDLESLLGEGHRARLVWSYVERQDLGRFYEGIRAVEGGVGRSAIAPEILLALWLYATLDGVGSAREIARLTGGAYAAFDAAAPKRLAELLEAAAAYAAGGRLALEKQAREGKREAQNLLSQMR